MAVLATGIATAKKIDNIGTGYNQAKRWTFNPSRDGKTFVANKDADCSSVCLSILKSMEPTLNMADPAYTGTFLAKAKSVGATAINVAGKSLAQIKALLKPGDFLLNTGNHVEFWTGSQLFSAAIDENGKISGGKPGDQTGKEVRFTGLYQYRKGWNYIVRPKYTAATTSGKSVATLAAEVIAGKYSTGEARKKALGAQYAAVQALVNKGVVKPPVVTKPAATTNKNTSKVKAVQKAVRAVQDGIVGPDTRKRVEAVRRSSKWGGKRFPYGVRYTQSVVGTYPDGVWGAKSRAAHDVTTANVQRAVGAVADCIWGNDTERKVKAIIG